MSIKFEVDSVYKSADRGCFISAKLIERGKEFWVTENSILGNIEITNNLSQTRAKDESGDSSDDLWTFEIKNELDFNKVQEGEILALFPGDKIKFLPPWMKIESEGSFEDELKKEISDEHLLFGKSVKAIAKREDNDDVLFEIGGQEMAIVHLTWKGNREASPAYPRTKIFRHWTAVYEKVIVADNKAYEV